MWTEPDRGIGNIGRIWVENRARSHLLYVEMENVEYYTTSGVWSSWESVTWVSLMAIVGVAEDVAVEDRKRWGAMDMDDVDMDM